ncbi:MAG TPA: protein kinase [Myxococcaceae bacterium]|nr:protein kinase [Myxococcaceae bacterium]
MTMFGQYELLRRLGTGGTAEVYLASGPNPVGDELIALKLVHQHLSEDEGLRKTFLNEARTASLIRHRNVVQIYEVGEVDGRPYLAMELVRGWPLNVVLKKLDERKQALTIPEVCAITREAALGLHGAHEATDREGRALGLVHRDVSPHNLILREDARVKVVDFGLAKATSMAATQTGGVKGKLAYMPPEQIEGKPLDRRTDVFALGAVLWELLAGQKLHNGKNDAEIMHQAMFSPQPRLDRVAPGIPRELVQLVESAIARKVDERIGSALALADALVPWVSIETPQRIQQRLQVLFEPFPRTVAEAKALTPAAPKRSPSSDRPRGASGERPVRAPRGSSGERPRAEERVGTGNFQGAEAPTVKNPVPLTPAQRERLQQWLQDKPGGGGQQKRSDATEVRPNPFMTEGQRDTLTDRSTLRDRITLGDGEAPERPTLQHDADVASTVRNKVPGFGDGFPTLSTRRPQRPQGHGDQAPAGAPSVLKLAVAFSLLALVGLGVVLYLRGRGEPTPSTATDAQPEQATKPQAPAPTPEPSPSGDTPPRAPEAPVRAAGGEDPGASRPSRKGGEGKLELRSDSLALVKKDGKELGMTPLSLTLPAGTHEFELISPDGRRQKRVTVSIKSGEHRTEPVTLTR